MKLYFYPHAYLRDRQLETIRAWPPENVLNPDIALNRRGAQVSKEKASNPSLGSSWKQKIPLVNLKLRPKEAPNDSTVYVWGGLIATGTFIVDLDNPWSLVGYNISAMPIYKYLIKRILLSKRCLEIRCLSNACRQSLKTLFGDAVFSKARVHYPVAGLPLLDNVPERDEEKETCKFLFVGSQFELKGGGQLLEAFRRARIKNSNIELNIITHLPEKYEESVKLIPSVSCYPVEFSRTEIFQKFFMTSDVLLHPSFMESFGMTVLEGIAHGLAVVANNIYALGEMVKDGNNGFLIEPPISKWSGVMPNRYFMQKNEFVRRIQELDSERYIESLESAILELASDSQKLQEKKKCSLNIFHEMVAN